MRLIDSARIHCPYCDVSLNINVDPSEPEQDYTEDCQVCCRPMVLSVQFDDRHQPRVYARRENDIFSPGD